MTFNTNEFLEAVKQGKVEEALSILLSNKVTTLVLDEKYIHHKRRHCVTWYHSKPCGFSSRCTVGEFGGYEHKDYDDCGENNLDNFTFEQLETIGKALNSSGVTSLNVVWDGFSDEKRFNAMIDGLNYSDVTMLHLLSRSARPPMYDKNGGKYWEGLKLEEQEDDDGILVSKIAKIAKKINAIPNRNFKLVIDDLNELRILRLYVEKKFNEKLPIYTLDLSYKNIDLAFVKDVLKPCLENYLPSLHELNMKGNCISYSGLRQLVAGLKKTEIAELYLQENYIRCGKKSFQDLETELEKCQQLKTVNLGQNFLEKECKPLFKKSSQLSNSYSYGFFQTKPDEPIKSLLSEKHTVNYKKWLVTVVCPKHGQHAMIYVEGMSKLGQRFLERYHITASGIISTAAVQVENTLEQIQPIDFDPKKSIIATPKEIDSVTGKTLKSLIENEKNKDISYSIVGSISFNKSSFSGSSSNKSSSGSGSNKKVNCLQWCLHKLKEAGIEFDSPPLPIPSSIGGGCLIM
jgi:hypothetical protein